MSWLGSFDDYRSPGLVTIFSTGFLSFLLSKLRHLSVVPGGSFDIKKDVMVTLVEIKRG